MASRPDALATAQLAQQVVRPRFLCWLDIVGDPVRATTWPVSLAISGTGDADLDGYTFEALNPDLVGVSPVKHQDAGSETVTISLSGLILPDAGLYAIIGNSANWRGRDARLWVGVCDENNVQQGAIWAYHTGKMTNLTIKGSADSQIIEASIETYLALIGPASNRTYMDQSYFDAADRASEVIAPSANGISNQGSVGIGGSFGGGGGFSAAELSQRLF